MKDYLKKSLLVSSITVPVVLGMVNFVRAQGYGLSQTANRSGLSRYSGSVETVAGSLVNNALTVVGILFFGMLIYGGIVWMLARGNEDRAQKALSTIISAMIGLIVITSSYAITTFVLNATSEQTSGTTTQTGGFGHCLPRGTVPTGCVELTDCPAGGDICHSAAGGVCVTVVEASQVTECSDNSQCPQDGFYCYLP